MVIKASSRNLVQGGRVTKKVLFHAVFNHKPHTCSYTFHSHNINAKMFKGGKLKGWWGEGSFLLIDVTLNSCAWE